MVGLNLNIAVHCAPRALADKPAMIVHGKRMHRREYPGMKRESRGWQNGE